MDTPKGPISFTRTSKLVPSFYERGKRRKIKQSDSFTGRLSITWDKSLLKIFVHIPVQWKPTLKAAYHLKVIVLQCGELEQWRWNIEHWHNWEVHPNTTSIYAHNIVKCICNERWSSQWKKGKHNIIDSHIVWGGVHHQLIISFHYWGK